MLPVRAPPHNGVHVWRWNSPREPQRGTESKTERERKREKEWERGSAFLLTKKRRYCGGNIVNPCGRDVQVGAFALCRPFLPILPVRFLLAMEHSTIQHSPFHNIPFIAAKKTMRRCLLTRAALCRRSSGSPYTKKNGTRGSSRPSVADGRRQQLQITNGKSDANAAPRPTRPQCRGPNRIPADSAATAKQNRIV